MFEHHLLLRAMNLEFRRRPEASLDPGWDLTRSGLGFKMCEAGNAAQLQCPLA
jgi:hypothetical protein